MIGCTHVQLCVQVFEQILPEVACEYLIPIRHNGGWKTVQLNYIIREQLSQLGSIVWVFQWQEMSIFRVSINNDQNYLKPIGLGQAFNKIHGN
jgi:hypothetical protein